MSDARNLMTAFVTSDVLDQDSLQLFLNLLRDGGRMRWRGVCWEIAEHKPASERNSHHSFRLRSASYDECS